MQAFCSKKSNPCYTARMQTGRPPKHPRCPFGQRLNELREEKGLTLQQVAENLGISLRAYGFWERRPVAIKPEQLAILCELFDTSADHLIGVKEERRSTAPKGKARKLLEEVDGMTRQQQQHILRSLEDLIAGQKARKNA